MSDNQPSLDEQLATITERARRLQHQLPAPSPAPSCRPAPRRDPLGIVSTILLMVASGTVAALLHDVGAIFIDPDDSAVVVKENNKYQIWNSVEAYETATGRRSLETNPGLWESMVTHHDARRDQALLALPSHALLLFASVLALVKLRQARKQALETAGIAKSGMPGARPVVE